MKAHTVPALADLDLDGTVDIVLPVANGNLYRLTDEGDVRRRSELPKPENKETPVARELVFFAARSEPDYFKPFSGPRSERCGL